MKDQLIDCTSILYNTLQELLNEVQELKQKADKIDNLHRCLVYDIQNDRITEQEQVDCAIAWLRHSDLSVEEILTLIR